MAAPGAIRGLLLRPEKLILRLAWVECDLPLSHRCNKRPDIALRGLPLQFLIALDSNQPERDRPLFGRFPPFRV